MSTVLPVLRRSAIGTARSCLYRYNKIWNEGVPDESVYALRGQAFHAAAYRYVLRLVEKSLIADHEEAVAAFSEGLGSAQTPATLVPEVRELYMRWAERFQLDVGAFLAAEEHQIGEEDMTFTPDVVYGRPHELEIVDFKTYWQLRTERQIREDFQARWYIYNAMKIWPNFPSYRFTMEFVRFGKSVSVVFSPDELADFVPEVAAVAASIEEADKTGTWPATAGDECGFCALQCPLADHIDTIPSRLKDLDTAQRAAELLLVATRLTMLGKKALRGWVVSNGPLRVGDVTWEIRPTVQRSYPIARVLDAMRTRKMERADDAEGLSISHSALSKLFREFPDMEQELFEYVHLSESSRFGAYKMGEDDEE